MIVLTTTKDVYQNVKQNTMNKKKKFFLIFFFTTKKISLLFLI
jgi:hypothetical protein